MWSSMDAESYGAAQDQEVRAAGQSRPSVFQMPQRIVDMPMGQGHPSPRVSSEEENVRDTIGCRA